MALLLFNSKEPLAILKKPIPGKNMMDQDSLSPFLKDPHISGWDGPDGAEELYDLRNNPYEWKNLAGENQHLLKKQALQEAMLNIIKGVKMQ